MGDERFLYKEKVVWKFIAFKVLIGKHKLWKYSLLFFFEVARYLIKHLAMSPCLVWEFAP